MSESITTIEQGGRARDYGPARLIVELANICNLHCSYCLRDEDALYHTRANFFSVDLLRRVMAEAREAIRASHVVFTGGETTLHPQFGEILAAVRDQGMKCSFVTNGWHFERVWPVIALNREAVTHVAFSLDGITREAHDKWRGEGSFVRLIRAFARCRHEQLPFVAKFVIRRDTLPQIEQIAMFAARMGATALSFGHLLPTSSDFDHEWGLNAAERREAEQEIALLARIFKMRITIEVGYYNLDPAAPCSALAGQSCNIDYRGRLSLCCNLSGFRNAVGELDVVADLNQEAFAPAFARLQHLAELQNTRRREMLAEQSSRGVQPELRLGSPCLYCLDTFQKTPWQASSVASRALPVMQSSLT